MPWIHQSDPRDTLEPCYERSPSTSIRNPDPLLGIAEMHGTPAHFTVDGTPLRDVRMKPASITRGAKRCPRLRQCAQQAPETQKVTAVRLVRAALKGRLAGAVIHPGCQKNACGAPSRV